MRAIVTVLGKDQVGIIASVCTLLAEKNVNVLDITQTILSDQFTMVMLVDTSAGSVPFQELALLLDECGRSRDLLIQIQREDIFNAMHRI